MRPHRRTPRRSRPTPGRSVSVLVPAVTVTAMLLGTIVVRTGSNDITAARASEESAATTPNTLKPSSCSAISLTQKRSGSGTINGNANAELIVAGSGVDVIDGAGGNDCILAGGGDDLNIRGGGGTDVCIGGPGTDTFHPSCETRIQ